MNKNPEEKDEEKELEVELTKNMWLRRKGRSN
jgi:hypothetical protein